MKILGITPVGAGVRHYRIEQPLNAVKRNNYADVDFRFQLATDISQLENYDIVHFHTAFIDENKIAKTIHDLNLKGVKVVIDIDDYFELPKTHQSYQESIRTNKKQRILNAITLANAVTTTNQFLADKIKVYNKNVYVIPNGIDFSEPQWNKKKNTDSEIFRYGLLTGSSHREDVEILRGVSNAINVRYKEKVGTILCGYDLRGHKTRVEYITQELFDDLKALNLHKQQLFVEIVKKHGDLTKVKGLPQSIVQKYGVIKPNIVKEEMNPMENVWYHYEQILTDNFNTIPNKQYVQNLHQFMPVDSFGDKSHYRIFTKDINRYAESYSRFNLSLAPLEDTLFNQCKSNLKQLEAGAYNLPIITSNVLPYNELSQYSILINNGKNQWKDWYKNISKLVENPQMGIDMGNSLGEVVRRDFDSNRLAEKRMEIYNQIIK